MPQLPCPLGAVTLWCMFCFVSLRAGVCWDHLPNSFLDSSYFGAASGGTQIKSPKGLFLLCTITRGSAFLYLSPGSIQQPLYPGLRQELHPGCVPISAF